MFAGSAFEADPSSKQTEKETSSCGRPGARGNFFVSDCTGNMYLFVYTNEEKKQKCDKYEKTNTKKTQVTQRTLLCSQTLPKQNERL